MESRLSQYEVRCFRCDVSFPVETRTCIHCGGATSAASESAGSAPVFEFGSRSGAENAPGWRGGENSLRESMGGVSDQPPPVDNLDERSSASPISEPTSEPSVGRSILGSMGSLIWIALLIAFSLAGRMCGDE